MARLWASDGSRLRHYDWRQVDIFDELPSKFGLGTLLCMAGDAAHHMVVGGTDGVMLDPSTTIKPASSFLRVTAAYSPSLGRWLAGMNDGGSKSLVEWDGSTVTDLSGNIVDVPLTLLWAKDRFYIGQANGYIHEYDGTSWSDLTATLGLSEDIMTMCFDGAYLYVGGGGGSLVKYDPSSGAVEDLTSALDASLVEILIHNPVTGELVAVHSGGMLASSADGGATWTDRTISGFYVRSATVGPDGELYVGGDGGAVKRISPDWSSVADLDLDLAGAVTALLATESHAFGIFVADASLSAADDYPTIRVEKGASVAVSASITVHHAVKVLDGAISVEAGGELAVG